MGFVLFYIGIVLMAGSLLAGGVVFFVFRVWRSKLKAQLDQEYGSKEKIS